MLIWPDSLDAPELDFIGWLRGTYRTSWRGVVAASSPAGCLAALDAYAADERQEAVGVVLPRGQRPEELGQSVRLLEFFRGRRPGSKFDLSDLKATVW
jgi:hypothetical protein